jgi:Tfp pilus assembly protein PilO
VKRGLLVGIIAGAVVLVLLWYFVLFAPTQSDLKSTRAEVAATDNQNQELQNTIRRLKELSRNATQQAATLRTLRAAIPANPDLGEFILQANDIASASGIEFLSIAPSPPVASTGSGPSTTIPVTIQIDGGFFEVLDYLNRLEDLERLMLVDSINVATSTESSSSGGSSGSSSSSSGGAPDLSVTLIGRLFTTAEAPAAEGTTTTPTTPSGGTTSTTTGGSSTTTPPASSSGTSS